MGSQFNLGFLQPNIAAVCIPIKANFKTSVSVCLPSAKLQLYRNLLNKCFISEKGNTGRQNKHRCHPGYLCGNQNLEFSAYVSPHKYT